MRRGTIAEYLSLVGRVGGREEMEVAFAQSGVIAQVFVQPDQQVGEGQVLLQTESQAIEHDLATVRARLDAAAQGDPAPQDSNSGEATDGQPPDADPDHARKLAEQDRLTESMLVRQLLATRVVAPFAGTVINVDARVGQQVGPGQPLVLLAKAGAPVLRVELTPWEATRVAVDQSATVHLGDASRPTLPASIAELEATSRGDSVAVLRVDWGAARPKFGAPARVRVAVRQHENVLLVPAAAVQGIGDHRLVAYLDGTSRRVATVRVGIVTTDQVEILSGLSDGQRVIARDGSTRTQPVLNGP